MRLPALIALLCLACALPAAAEAPPPSLAQVFAGQFRFGFGGTHDKAVREALLTPGSTIRQIVEQHSNIIGINCFYPAQIHPKAEVWKWENCDALLGFAEQHPDWPRRAHILFWPFHRNSNMEWLIRAADGQPVSREEAIRRLRDYIHTVMGRYKGRFQYWDVLNEVIDPKQPDGLHKGLWKDVLGAELVELAFRFAREADPGAKLFYNDFRSWNPEKRELIYTLVKNLKDKGLIDGIGLQQHLKGDSPTPAQLDETLARFASLGLEMHVTELDHDVNGDGRLDAFTPEMAEAQARRYREIFAVYRQYAGQLTAVMTWNLTDANSWLRRNPQPRPNWPLLFDENGQPKPALWALVKP